MKTLFLYIPHFTFTSDLLRTNFIGELAKKFKIIVFSPTFQNNDVADYFQHPNLEYVAADVEYPKFWLIFTKLFRLAMVREFDQLEYLKLRWREKTNWNWQRIALRMVSKILPSSMTTADFFTRLEKRLLPASKKFKAYVEKYHPTIILTCTPGFTTFEAEAIVQAKKLRLPTVAIDSSWDNYTSNSVQIRKTDYLICWNKQMKNEAMELHGYPENKVFISGAYRFDHHFQRANSASTNAPAQMDFLKSKGLDPNRKTLLLATLPPNTYPKQYAVWETLINWQKENKFNEPVNLFFRIHPNDEPERYKKYEGIPNVHIELAGHSVKGVANNQLKVEMDENDLDNLYYSLKYTDININFRSSLNLETVIYDTPSINLALYGYRPRYHVDWYMPLVESGGIKLVATEEELKTAINNYLENPKLDSEGRKKIFDEYIGFRDGLSYQRSVEAIEKIASGING